MTQSEEDTKRTVQEASNWGTKDSVYSIVVHDLPDRDGYHATEQDAERFVHGQTPADAARNYVLEVARRDDLNARVRRRSQS